MNKREEREVSNMIMEQVMELKLTPYHTIFLENMILERLEHPTMKMDELAKKVMMLMPEKYIKIHHNKSLENLEEELHESKELMELSEKVNDDFFQGKIVKNVVLYFTNEVLEQY